MPMAPSFAARYKPLTQILNGKAKIHVLANHI